MWSLDWMIATYNSEGRINGEYLPIANDLGGHLKHLPYYIEATSDSKLVKYFNAKMGAVGA